MNETNVGRGIAVAVVTAGVLSLPYALIVKSTTSNFSLLAIGVGLASGFSARRLAHATGIAVAVVAAIATFLSCLVADALAINWIIEDAGFSIPLSETFRLIRPLSWAFFALGAYFAFRAAGGIESMRHASHTAGDNRFTPATAMTPPAQPTPPAPWPSSPEPASSAPAPSPATAAEPAPAPAAEPPHLAP